MCQGSSLPLCRLPFCRVTKEGCNSLASALTSNPSHLRELDLSYNYPGDSGVKMLSATMEDPACRLNIKYVQLMKVMQHLVRPLTIFTLSVLLPLAQY
jgi:hypothetical protein